MLRSIDQYLFGEQSPFNLGVSRAVYFAWVFIMFSVHSPTYRQLAEINWQPIHVFRVLPIFSDSMLTVIDAVFVASVVLSCIGLLTRIGTVAAFLSGVYVIGLSQNFGKVSHYTGLVVIGMGILAISRSGDAFSLDAVIRHWRGVRPPTPSGEYRWPIRLIWVAMCAAFFVAGLSKLRGSGWFSSDGLSSLLIWHHYLHDRQLPSLGLHIAEIKWLCAAMALGALAAEIGAPLALVNWRLRLVIIPMLLLMQIGNSYLIGVHGGVPWIALYGFWVPWERLVKRKSAAQTGVGDVGVALYSP